MQGKQSHKEPNSFPLKCCFQSTGIWNKTETHGGELIVSIFAHHYSSPYHVREPKLCGGYPGNLAQNVEPSDDPSDDRSMFKRNQLCRCSISKEVSDIDVFFDGGTTHSPPHVGNALTISAIELPVDVDQNYSTKFSEKILPNVKHMDAPKIQHQVTCNR